jgi:hypothetical protein
MVAGLYHILLLFNHAVPTEHDWRPMAAVSQESSAPTPTGTYSVRQHPYYSRFIVRALSNLVAQHGSVKTNHFYISKIEEYASGYSGPWVYWKERRVLMTWDRNAGTNKQGELDPGFDLVSWWPRHVYRLDKDLVNGPYANGNDRLRKRDAAEIIRNCIRTGDLFILKSD